jgi:hypothetical protein
VPSLNNPNFAYDIFHSVTQPYQGVGRGARPPVEPVSEKDRFSKLHCGRCMKPLSDSSRHKALNKSAWYKVCSECDEELRARGGLDSMEVWKCPTTAEGGSGCKCCAVAKKQQVCGGKRKKGGKGFSSPKKRKWTAHRKNESQEGDQ